MDFVGSLTWTSRWLFIWPFGRFWMAAARVEASTLTKLLIFAGWWWLEPWNFMNFHILGIATPTDELIFFRGVGIPPTSSYLCCFLFVSFWHCRTMMNYVQPIYDVYVIISYYIYIWRCTYVDNLGTPRYLMTFVVSFCLILVRWRACTSFPLLADAQWSEVERVLNAKCPFVKPAFPLRWCDRTHGSIRGHMIDTTRSTH